MLGQLILQMNPDVEMVVLEGAMSAKKRREALTKLNELKAQNKKIILMATASLIGEGFDLPALDTFTAAHY